MRELSVYPLGGLLNAVLKVKGNGNDAGDLL